MEEPKIKWEQFCRGDKEAYEWIYNFYVQDLFRYGVRFCTDEEVVKDCIQELFTSLYKSRHRLLVPHNVKAYLFSCLKHNLWRISRKRSVFRQVELHMMPFMPEPTVEELFIEQEHFSLQSERIDRALSALTPRQQEIIYYRFVHSMSFEEIGRLMNMNCQSAQNLVQRALKKLRDLPTRP